MRPPEPSENIEAQLHNPESRRNSTTIAGLAQSVAKASFGEPCKYQLNFDELVASQGFEPQYAESESAVLPLNDEATSESPRLGFSGSGPGRVPDHKPTCSSYRDRAAGVNLHSPSIVNSILFNPHAFLIVQR